MIRSAAPEKPLRWRIAGVLAAGLFIVLVARHWRPVFYFTDLIQLDAGNDELKIAAFRERPIYVYRNTGGYDGLYYAQIAYDPLLGNQELRRAVDSLSYRAHRILPSMGAWILSFGQPAVIVHVYSLLNVFLWLASALLLWVALPVTSGRSFVAWSGILFSAGTLASVRFSLTDLPATALLGAGVFWAEQRRRGVGGWIGAAALTRETSLLTLASTIERPWLSKKNFAQVILAGSPLFLWLLFLRWRVGSSEGGFSNLTWPLSGYVGKWRELVSAFSTEGDWRPVAGSLLALIGISVQAAYLFSLPRLQDRWWRLGGVFVLMLCCLSQAVWEGFPGAFTRVLLPLTLAFNVMAARRREPFGWLLLGNLTICTGIWTLAEVHRDPRELCEARVGGRPIVATVGAGWYGMEQTRRHVWTWCQQRGSIRFETWPKVDTSTILEFSLRGTQAQEIMVTQDGVELWHGAVGTTRGSAQKCVVSLHAGIGELVFSTVTPARHEGEGDGARKLAFALYDPALASPRQ